MDRNAVSTSGIEMPAITEPVVNDQSDQETRRVRPPSEAANRTLASTASRTAFPMQLADISLYLFLADSERFPLAAQLSGDNGEDLPL